MVCCMKTTLNLDDELIRRAKRRALDRGTTLTALVEAALRASLEGPPQAKAFTLHVPTVLGESPPRIDPVDRQALHDLMDGEGATR